MSSRSLTPVFLVFAGKWDTSWNVGEGKISGQECAAVSPRIFLLLEVFPYCSPSAARICPCMLRKKTAAPLSAAGTKPKSVPFRSPAGTGGDTFSASRAYALCGVHPARKARICFLQPSLFSLPFPAPACRATTTYYSFSSCPVFPGGALKDRQAKTECSYYIS